MTKSQGPQTLGLVSSASLCFDFSSNSNEIHLDTFHVTPTSFLANSGKLGLRILCSVFWSQRTGRVFRCGWKIRRR